MADIDVERIEGESGGVPSAASSKWTGRRWIVVAVVVAFLAVGGVAAAVIANGDGGPSYGSDQIGWMHQGCQQWADSYQGPNGPGAGWCTSMTDWMSGRMGQAQDGMMGSMMWQDPDSMRTTCQQWMGDEPMAASGGRAEWCDQMVEWMNERMGDWDQWMRDGPRMGRP